jgi:tryptophanyl-tRNA synthetase
MLFVKTSNSSQFWSMKKIKIVCKNIIWIDAGVFVIFLVIFNVNQANIGKDQEQHLEMARNYVKRFNHRYGEVFPEPMAYNFGEDLVKVPSLDGAGKMSKSENQLATLYLADTDEMIAKKVMKAKTDAGPTAPNTPKPDYIENIFQLMELVCDKSVIDHFEVAYQNCNIRYGDLKKQLAEDMVKFITPIREKAESIRNDKKYLEEVMEMGAQKARQSAAATMDLVRSAMGLNY